MHRLAARARVILLTASVAGVLGIAGCGLVGKGLAGGQGDPNLFDVVPPVPSVPVQLGEYLVGKPVGEGGFARVHAG